MAPTSNLKPQPFELRSTILAADGTPIATIYEKNRRAIPQRLIPRVMKDAIVAAEDGRFFDHAGIDARAILRALIVDASAGGARQGGSTITQQLAKMMYAGDGRRSLSRKIEEARIAISLERRYTKQQIMAMYLNRAYFGAHAYGLGAAVETYFGAIPLRKLTVAQAALIAGLVKAPTVLDPFRNPDAARARRSYVLGRMRALGMITEEQRAKADQSPLGVPDHKPRRSVRHPYFVSYVEQQLLRDARLGATVQERERLIDTGGLRIHTSLDIGMQRAAEEAVGHVFDRASDPDAALVAIDPRTGEVKAMVGGRSFRRDQFNAAVDAMRQPGSAFKPFVLAAALEAGKSPQDRYASWPTTLKLPDGSSWPVNNFDGRSHGTITLREGMIHSVNGVYARLVVDVGARNVVKLAHRAGITSPLDPFPSIALGALRIGVSPLQMASAYGTFAANGLHYPAHGVTFVSRGGSVPYLVDQRAMDPTHAIDPQTAYTVTDVLQDVARKGTAKPANIGRPMGAKTGTTEEHKDAWLVGFTPDLVTAVWMGYRKPKPMNNVHGIKVVGASFPAQIWREFMSKALADSPPKDFKVPGGLVRVRVGNGGTCLASWGREVELPEPLVPTKECSSSDGGGSSSNETTVTTQPATETTPVPTKKHKGKPR